MPKLQKLKKDDRCTEEIKDLILQKLVELNKLDEDLEIPLFDSS